MQVTCKNKTFCRGRGTNVVLTDSIHRQTRLRNVGIDLILSDRAFMSMAAKGKARELLALRSHVEVEYERIPCEYKNQNMSIKVDESNKKRDRFVLTLLYQGGQTGIFSISVSVFEAVVKHENKLSFFLVCLSSVLVYKRSCMVEVQVLEEDEKVVVVASSGSCVSVESIEMLSSLNIPWVILNLFERSALLNESNEFLRKKVGYALSQGFKVIAGVSETLE
ncbi:hypothetical protein C5167_024815 [Papaver somniferum]|uniref:Expansin-like EG45 domain-containing protein n=1 Tax=Papaver somniferum TaxID=3469 RepID=A0A4Y7JTP9_PAPSO|nr:hypothetical protein C5167_024815 [Papaver somniferum]